MKLLLFALMINLTAIGFADVAIDFEQDWKPQIASGFGVSTERTPLAGKRSLAADTTAAPRAYTEVLTMRPGFLKPRTAYRISFDYRFELRTDKMCHAQYFLRSAGARGKDLHTMQFGAPELDGDVGRVDFSAWIDDTEDYALSIGMFGAGKLAIDNIRIVSETQRAELALEGTSGNWAPPPTITGCPDFSVELPSLSEPVAVIRAERFGLAVAAADNTDALNRALAECRKQKNGAVLDIPQGVYRFKNPKAIEIVGLKDVRIRGNFSEFILADATPGEFIWFRNCLRVELRDLTVDWDWESVPLASRVTVSAVAEDGSYADLKFVDYDTVPVSDEAIRAVNGHKRTDSNGVFSLFDNLQPNRSRVHFVPQKVEFPGQNIARIYGAKNSSLLKREFVPGRSFRLRHFFMNRKAFKVDDSQHLTLRNVTIHSAPGAGFVFKRQTKFIQLLECRIVPRAGRLQPVTTSGDLFHQIYTEGYFKLDGCIFNGGGDDMMNIKGCNSFGVRKIAENILLADHIQEWQMQYEPGNRVALLTRDFKPFWSGEIAAAVYDRKEKAFRLTFKQALPATLPYHTVVVNTRYNSDHYVIRNSTFINGEAQGLLLQASNGTVENCIFADLKGPAIQISAGFCPTWSEGDRISNIVIRNNRFRNCNWESRTKFGQSETVYLGMYSLFGRSGADVIRNVLFEGNRFEDTNGLAFFITSAERIVLKDNVFGFSSPAPWNRFPNAVMVEDARKVYLVDNQWRAGGARLILSRTETEEIFFRGNHCDSEKDHKEKIEK